MGNPDPTRQNLQGQLLQNKAQGARRRPDQLDNCPPRTPKQSFRSLPRQLHQTLRVRIDKRATRVKALFRGPFQGPHDQELYFSGRIVPSFGE